MKKRRLNVKEVRDSGGDLLVAGVQGSSTVEASRSGWAQQRLRDVLRSARGIHRRRWRFPARLSVELAVARPE
ncbi:hypothetical protein M6B38_159660 [Iris pallida]|uniref:Uncharacterized protein n=1 Tax=Iris pallida TaxID=29817 RepID=A0AAX6F0M1_IRIPA|nr:hypothetical protein M6B38_159655 [Iris pallida]KAJ6809877.1 hypothetical protein M6B38_159660 [Iris pallida]